MATENSRRIPLDKAASFDEITDAINSLTRIQLKKLEKFARWRVKGLGRKNLGRSWEDLFHETIISFCSEDRRRWNKEKVDFVKAMTEAMRSISDNWKRSFDESEPKLEAELLKTPETSKEPNLYANAATSNWDTQKCLEAKEKLEMIDNLVSARERSALIIMGMRDKMTGAEIRKDLDLSQKEYETERTWILRTLRAAFKEMG